MSTYTISDYTPAEYRAMAADCRRRSTDSFDRCDTDGFVSQWAADSMARTYSRLAELAEDGGDVQKVRWLFTADGTPVDEWRWVSGEYGSSVRVWHNHRVHWFRPSEARKGSTREKRDRAKGFVWGIVSGRAHLVTKSAGYFNTTDVVELAENSAAGISQVHEVGGYTDYTS